MGNKKEDNYLKKELYELIRTDESIFDFIQESSLDGLWYWDLENTENEWMNPKFWTVLGYNPEEMPHKSSAWQQIINQDDLKVASENFTKHCENPSHPYDQIVRYAHKNGSTVWIRCRGLAIRDENGKPVRMLGAHHEITDIKHSESELRIAKEKTEESEILKKKLLANIGDVIVIIDHEGNNRYKSPNVEKLFGWKPEELISQNTFDNIHPEDVEKSRNFINSLLSKPNKTGTTEVRYRHKNGNYFWIKFTGSNLLHDPVINGILGNYHDITESKKAQLELIKIQEKANKYTEMIISSQSVANICSYSTNLVEENLEKSVWECSPEFYKIFGIDETYPHTIAGWAGFIHPDFRKELVAYHESVVKTKTSFNKEYKIIRINDGAERWVHGTGELVYDKQGNPVRMHGAIQDITETKKTEDDLIKAKDNAEEANRLKTEFLNNMSHEIRTPMNGIIGFSQMLDEPDLSEEKRKYYSKIVQNSSHQLLRIIDDIMEISTLETKQEKLNETQFCLNDLLMELFSIFNLKSKERNIPLYLKKALHNDQSHIVTDKTKLNKILSNLIENALKFTNEGFVEFGYHLAKANLILYVKDTGIGISPKNHEIIFERFSQEDKEISSKHGGLGLGLSICKENAKLIGGEITLESEKGNGSTFSVTIPYKPAQNKNDNSNKKFDGIKKTNDQYTILIAEDEEVNYLYLEILFENEIDRNYKTIHAKNGKEAVESCISNNINLVLMDIKMPLMNGLEAAEKIKEKFPDLPIIAQTAYSTESDKQLALKHGCGDFISKPIDKEKLFTMINKYLNVSNLHY